MLSVLAAAGGLEQEAMSDSDGLVLQVCPVPEDDVEELAELTGLLRGELLDLDVSAVDQLPDEAVPLIRLDDADADWLKAVLGAKAAQVDSAEEHHGALPEDTPKTAATVSSISAVHCRYAPGPGADPKIFCPVPNLAVLTELPTADGWTLIAATCSSLATLSNSFQLRRELKRPLALHTAAKAPGHGFCPLAQTGQPAG
jgi:hypothetical protein